MSLLIRKLIRYIAFVCETENTPKYIHVSTPILKSEQDSNSTVWQEFHMLAGTKSFLEIAPYWVGNVNDMLSFEI